MKQLLSDQRTRFLFVGGINTLVGYLLFVAAYAILPGSYLTAFVISYAAALFSGFILQKILVFRVSGKLILDFLRYTSVQLVAFFLNLAILPLVVRLLGNVLVSQAISLTITLILSYFAHRYFTFRRASTHPTILEKEK